jgi:branched-chain amino acid transport system permease protein
MTWEQSGELMFMVILGGMATSAGPVLGAFALLLGEELLKALLGLRSQGWIEHWQILMGPLLVLSVIFFRRGLAGIFHKPDA